MRNRTVLNVGRVSAGLVLTAVVAAVASQTPLPAVPYPAENSPTDAKRVLGKILFFEEQLSADNTMACATCHVMSHGGTDPRRLRNPGKNETFGDAGDVFGSPGVLPMSDAGTYSDKSVFGAARQVTPRTTPSPFLSDYAESVLWDGRASDQFVDPVSGEVVIESGGALESQALLPLVNPTEMGHAGREMPEILAKLAKVTPLALADRLPPDMAAALAGDPSYGELFRRAFGDAEITAPRVAMALTTYERTLVPDQTDYDRFIAGDTTALSEKEQRGLAALKDAGCEACHAAPLFTDNSFRATGVRPHRDDDGRGGITDQADDAGRFKVPTLRNVALKSSFFHDGKRTTLHEAIKFYARAENVKTPGVFTTQTSIDNRNPEPSIDGTPILPPIDPVEGGSTDPVVGYGSGTNPEEVQFIENQDPAMADIHLTPEMMDDIEAFLTGGLVDSRVQDEAFPFDRPLLATDHIDLQPQVVTTNVATSPVVEPSSAPTVVVTTPAIAGSEDFRVGVALPDASATGQLVTWTDGVAPVTSAPVTLEPDNTSGLATVFIPLTDVKPGDTLHIVWRTQDPWLPGVVLESKPVDVPVFAPRPLAVPVATMKRAAVSPAQVDDTDAYVARSSLVVDWNAHRRGVDRDTFTASARLNIRGAGTDVSQARLTVRVGETEILSEAALDADGKLHTDRTDAQFDVATGSLLVQSAGADLAPELYVTRTGDHGRLKLPVTISVKGLGLAEPTVSTQIPYAWKRKGNGVVAARFDLSRNGNETGTFQVAQASVTPLDRGVARVIVRGTLAAPQGDLFAAPEGLVLRIGNSYRLTLPAAQMTVSKRDKTIVAKGLGALRSLRIEPKTRTFSFDVLVDDPALVAMPEKSVIPLRLRLEASPKAGAPVVSYETIADVIVR